MLTILFTIELFRIPSGWCFFRTQTDDRTSVSPTLDIALFPFCVQNYEFHHVTLVYAFLPSVDAYHVRCWCWRRLLAVHLEGRLCLDSFLLDVCLSIGGCVCLIFPFWILLVGRHGVFCSLFLCVLCLMVFLRFGSHGSIYSLVLVSCVLGTRLFFMSCLILRGSFFTCYFLAVQCVGFLCSLFVNIIFRSKHS